MVYGRVWDASGMNLRCFWYVLKCSFNIFRMFLELFWHDFGVLDCFCHLCGYFCEAFKMFLKWFWNCFGVFLGWCWHVWGVKFESFLVILAWVGMIFYTFGSTFEWFWHNFKVMLGWFWYGCGMILVWFCNDFELIWTFSLHDFALFFLLILVWYWFDFGMIVYVVGMIVVWFWREFGMDEQSFINHSSSGWTNGNGTSPLPPRLINST